MTRIDELREATKLIGWSETRRRIKTKDDRKLFQELENEYDHKSQHEIDLLLKRCRISF